VAQGVGNIRYI